MVVGTISTRVSTVVITASFNDRVIASENPTCEKTWPNALQPVNWKAA